MALVQIPDEETLDFVFENECTQINIEEFFDTILLYKDNSRSIDEKELKALFQKFFETYGVQFPGIKKVDLAKSAYSVSELMLMADEDGNGILDMRETAMVIKYLAVLAKRISKMKIQISNSLKILQSGEELLKDGKLLDKLYEASLRITKQFQEMHDMQFELLRIEEFFETLDEDHDGKVQREEFEKILPMILGNNMSKEHRNYIEKSMYETDSPEFGVHANGVDFEKAWNVLDRYSVGYLDILQVKTLYHYAVVKSAQVTLLLKLTSFEGEEIVCKDDEEGMRREYCGTECTVM
mmetsp:Transcript_11349/g.20829  ORF Transcript_11349/g.20829 Transcript_11349/m.20829 type:complete len:296 (+) Transcript_11349:239-1126(+)|eukprot:CAMPEP_0197519252 /NCGR_PEP_ID=MMETSP1318-20131121/4514_1 /TAXON_ID=552666 /ORGANISM="Partenskyella glossopodia, Strain RCC365" /LENGTH=295 /DNA_ID=CAMNT_0043070119 /DNA_START=123 /DNA_END=1010 /DNA_ORIENTATION=+